MLCRFLCLSFVLLAPLWAQQTQQQRDLKIEDLRAAPKQAAVVIPRSYALVVGIAGYQDPRLHQVCCTPSATRKASSTF
jgi:hypothetical protein